VEHLLTTKLYIPPTRPELVPRQRLVERLDEGQHRKSTLIAALNRLEGIETVIGEEVRSMLHASHPSPTESFSTYLINDGAAIPNSLILVLDDDHTTESSLVSRVLPFLLNRPPP
jgi:LuxR family maltose regulon positive regulatory protein